MGLIRWGGVRLITRTFLPATLLACLIVSPPLARSSSPCVDSFAPGPGNTQDLMRSCPKGGFACPSRGIVDVNWSYNFNADTADVDGDGDVEQFLDDCEIQCAIDCIDGDPAQESAVVQLAWQPGPPHPLVSVAPSPVPGGRVQFDPTIPYRIERGLRLPARATGAVHLIGNGATIHVVGEGYAAIERRLIGEQTHDPHGATAGNECDAVAMAEATREWSIQDLRLIADRGTAVSGWLEGIRFTGGRGLSVERCLFEASSPSAAGFDRAVAFQACESCRVVSGRFRDSREADIAIMGAQDPAPLADAWTACASCPSGPGVWFEAAPGTTGDCGGGGGSHQAVAMRTMHEGSSGVTSILVQGSDGVRVVESRLSGERPKHFLKREGTGRLLVMRDCRLATTECDSTSALIHDSVGGLLVIDGGSARGTCEQGQTQLLLEVDQPVPGAAAETVLRGFMGLADPLRLAGANQQLGDRSRGFYFEANAGDRLPSEHGLWAHPGHRPERAMLVSGDALLLPPSPANVTVEDAGRLWMQDGRVYLCCGPDGRPRYIASEEAP